jgi:methionyl-tRNA synthetase
LIEQNYYFKLRDHQTWLIDHIEAHPEFIGPSYRRNEVLGFLKNNTLEDLCISRPAARLNWGIPLPFDPDYVTYVWFDALVNYVSVPAAHHDPSLTPFHPDAPASSPDDPLELWPADVHVIGKDILKFHAVYWPIMLKAMELPLPRRILAHGWWQKDSQKISKTTGNIVEPIAVINDWGLDAFRYYVVRELDIGPDGNWTDAGFQARYQAELANGLGNLVNRSLSMLQRYRDGLVPAPSRELAPEITAAVERIESLLKNYQLKDALETIWAIINRANQYVDQTAPFKLAKDPTRAARLDEVLYNLVEVCRQLAVLIHPFLPDTARRIFSQLNLENTPQELSPATWGSLKSGHSIGKPQPLFPPKDPAPRPAPGPGSNTL